MKNDILLIRKFIKNQGTFWANNKGDSVHGVRETDQAIAFLTVDPTCTLPWMPYTACESFPDGVIRGGRLPDGSATFAIKMNCDDGSASFGYYNAESQQGYHLFHNIDSIPNGIAGITLSKSIQ